MRVLTALLTPHVPFAYMLASVISGLLAISFSFLNYKWFIFKTKGTFTGVVAMHCGVWRDNGDKER